MTIFSKFRYGLYPRLSGKVFTVAEAIKLDFPRHLLTRWAVDNKIRPQNNFEVEIELDGSPTFFYSTKGNPSIRMSEGELPEDAEYDADEFLTFITDNVADESHIEKVKNHLFYGILPTPLHRPPGAPEKLFPSATTESYGSIDAEPQMTPSHAVQRKQYLSKVWSGLNTPTNKLVFSFIRTESLAGHEDCPVKEVSWNKSMKWQYDDGEIKDVMWKTLRNDLSEIKRNSP